MKNKLRSRATRVALTTLTLLLLPWTLPAQASSIDTDGDKLPDIWETQGYDADGDGVIDIDFPAMGANPYRKDLFIEMDWMPRNDGGIELAPAEDLDRIVDVFAQFPIRNPDGSTGISLHLDAGSARGDKYNLGGGNQVAYSTLSREMDDLFVLKNQPGNFDPAREGIFYYMIWADKYGTTSSSGLARLNGMDFFVTLGQTYYSWANGDMRVGTFIHELGHTLGLEHGGNDEVNRKPNYLSVMNYGYQFRGVPRTSGPNYFGFSTRAGLTLDENALSEARGLGPATAGYTLTISRFGFIQAPAHKNLDINQNGVIDRSPVQADLNGDKQFTKLTAPNDMTLLRFKSKAFPAGLSADEAEVRDMPNELTADDARDMGLIP